MEVIQIFMLANPVEFIAIFFSSLHYLYLAFKKNCCHKNGNQREQKLLCDIFRNITIAIQEINKKDTKNENREEKNINSIIMCR